MTDTAAKSSGSLKKWLRLLHQDFFLLICSTFWCFCWGPALAHLAPCLAPKPPVLTAVVQKQRKHTASYNYTFCGVNTDKTPILGPWHFITHVCNLHGTNLNDFTRDPVLGPTYKCWLCKYKTFVGNGCLQKNLDVVVGHVVMVNVCLQRRTVLHYTQCE